MAAFAPFHAIRYRDAGADQSAVCAPPYDVIGAADRVRLATRDPHNAVRLILPESYEAGASTFRRWLAEGVLAADEQPAFCVYTMDFDAGGGRRVRTTGVLGALGLADDDPSVMPHERTLPSARTDRLELLRATRANFDPIWGLSLAAGLTELLDVQGDPLAHAAEDGVEHRLWRVTEADHVRAVAEAVAGARIVLADGHHRYATARTYRDERRRSGVADPGADAILALVVELAAPQLCVRAIHRVLHGVQPGDLLAALEPTFSISRLDGGPLRPGVVAGRVHALEAAMAARGALGWIDARGCAVLTPRDRLQDLLAGEPAVLHEVDSARFEAGIAPHLAGADVTYHHDAEGAAADVAAGTADALVLLRPVEVDTIRVAAEAGVLMPQKTTFFTPKPRTGLAMRDLERP